MVIFQDYKLYKFLGLITFLLFVSCSEENKSPVSTISESRTTGKFILKRARSATIEEWLVPQFLQTHTHGAKESTKELIY